MYELLEERGIALPVLEDLTSLELATGSEAYEYLYKTYWPECEKRFLVSARPEGRRRLPSHSRSRRRLRRCDSVARLSRPGQRELFGKFLADMPAGNAVVLGWYSTERSGVTTATRFGIGAMPADHFMNATVLAGGPHEIRVPPAPEPPRSRTSCT